MNSRTKTTIGLIISLILFIYGLYSLGFKPPSEDFNALPLICTVAGLSWFIIVLAKLKDEG